MLLNKILQRNPNWVGHIIRGNCLLPDAIDDRREEAGRRRTQLLDDFRNGRRCWELKEEAED
jgi:hypothetical protein